MKNTIDTEFIRISPEQYSGHMIFQHGWIVLPHKLISDKRARRKIHGHWIKITSVHGSIYRVASFHGNLKTMRNKAEPAEMVIDWVGWVDLYDHQENVDPPLRLQIRKVKFHEYFWIYFLHPEPFNRLVSWMSAFFSLVGVLVGYLLSEFF